MLTEERQARKPVSASAPGRGRSSPATGRTLRSRESGHAASSACPDVASASAGGSGRAAALDTPANNADRRRGERRSDRYLARDLLRRMSSVKRVADCGNALGGEVSVRSAGGVGGFGGLSTCGSVWACPVCSAKILSSRQGEVAAAVDFWAGGLGLVTLTLRHTRRDPLAGLWDDLAAAWRLLGKSAGWKAARAGGLVHYVRATEVTHGSHGWHLHFHVLVFFAPGLDESSQRSLMLGVQSAWLDAVAQVGRRAVSAAQDVQVVGADRRAVGDYLTKGLYGRDRVAAEVTRGDYKVGKGRTQWEVLQSAVGIVEGDAADIERWFEWEAASQGRRMLTWSRGLRALVLAADQVEVTDEELAAAEVGTEDDTVGVLTATDWHEVRRVPGRCGALIAAVSVPELALARRQADDLLASWGLRFCEVDVRLGSRRGPLPPGSDSASC